MENSPASDSSEIEATRRRAGAREASKAETREALMDAAITLFAEQGFDGPSLDAICASAGYTRGAFYVHFADREELIAAVMDRVLGAFLDAVIATGDGAMDLERTVHTFVMAMDAGAFPMTGTVKLEHFLAACARSEAVRGKYVELVEGAMRRLAHAVRDGQRAGTVRADVDADQIGMLLVSIVLGVEMMIQTRTPFDVHAGAEAVLTLVRTRKP